MGFGKPAFCFRRWFHQRAKSVFMKRVRGNPGSVLDCDSAAKDRPNQPNAHGSKDEIAQPNTVGRQFTRFGEFDTVNEKWVVDQENGDETERKASPDIAVAKTNR